MWEQVRSNRRRSAFVVTAMGVLLVASGCALGAVFGGARLEPMLVGGGVALALWFVLWIVSINQGDRVVLGIARAREIEKGDHPQLVNVVEEMTIAAGLPKRPRIYIIDDPSPNAFATGRDPENASVAATTGLLRLLNRDELQGVMAHEIGHVKNRDVKLMTTAAVMAGVIVLIAEIGIHALWFGGARRRSRSDGGQGQGLLVVAALLFVILAPIFAQLIYLALSRRREYLADASGAMFTRYPEGLASALGKLGGAGIPLADQSRVTRPMYIVRPLSPTKRKASSLTATHPPLEDRIRILRSMGGAADYRAYEAAYRAHHEKGVVGARSLAEVPEVPAREAAPDASTPAERRRAASDAFLTASGYVKRTCTRCGAKLKVPPSMQDRVTECVRCGGPLA